MLQADTARIKVLAKYLNNDNIYFLDLVIELLENIGINEHAIELIDGKKLFYGSIYAFSLIKLKTFQFYIKT